MRGIFTHTNNIYDSELFGPTGREFLSELSLSDADQTIIEPYLSVIDAYTEHIERVEKKIERKILGSPAIAGLLAILAVGQYTAAVIVAKVGKVERFDKDKQLVSYAGLDLVVRQSGGKKVRGSISKEGSTPLHWTLVQCANISVRCGEYFGNFYTRLKERKSHQIAIVATARKILVSIFYIITRKEPYNPPEVKRSGKLLRHRSASRLHSHCYRNHESLVYWVTNQSRITVV